MFLKVSLSKLGISIVIEIIQAVAGKYLIAYCRVKQDLNLFVCGC